MEDLSLILAFGAGLLSFVSPCVFPLYPAFISYITGMSAQDIKTGNSKTKQQAMLHTLFFLIGFAIIYLVLGFSTSALSVLFNQYSDMIRQIGALFIIIFGFITLGVWQSSLLMKQLKPSIKNRPPGYIGTTILGIAFAAGWTPCMGPILGAVLALISTNPSSGLLYMLTYIAGFAIPFFVLSFFIVKLNWMKKHSGVLMKIGGIIMVIAGTLLFFDKLTLFNRLLAPIFGDFQGF